MMIIPADGDCRKSSTLLCMYVLERALQLFCSVAKRSHQKEEDDKKKSGPDPHARAARCLFEVHMYAVCRVLVQGMTLGGEGGWSGDGAKNGERKGPRGLAGVSLDSVAKRQRAWMGWVEM